MADYLSVTTVLKTSCLLSYQDTSDGPGTANTHENICSNLERPRSEDSLIEEDDRHLDKPKCQGKQNNVIIEKLRQCVSCASYYRYIRHIP